MNEMPLLVKDTVTLGCPSKHDVQKLGPFKRNVLLPR